MIEIGIPPLDYGMGNLVVGEMYLVYMTKIGIPPLGCGRGEVLCVYY